MNLTICHTFLGHDKNNNNKCVCMCVFLIFSLDFSIEFLFELFSQNNSPNLSRAHCVFTFFLLFFLCLYYRISFTSKIHNTQCFLSIIPNVWQHQSMFVLFFFSGVLFICWLFHLHFTHTVSVVVVVVIVVMRLKSKISTMKLDMFENT